MSDMRKPLRRVLLMVVTFCATGLLVVYFFDPSNEGIYPLCPFLALTGLRCPGCGTLWALHSLLHGRFLAAWEFNPALIVSIPVIALLLAFPKVVRNSMIGWGVFVAIILWWVGRNVFGTE